MKNYKNLFEQIKQFKKEQEKQKQRGLNNYNILTTVLKEHDEVRLHSRMIASFLDPSGEHYQSTLFLDKFLEILNVSNFKIDSKNCSVYREYKNIDIYITDGHKHIILENKVYATDQPKQIKRYIEEITKKENKNLKLNDVLVIYLSLDRIEPSSDSLNDLSIENGIIKEETKEISLFKSIHYKNEILDWLEKCKYEVQNITNLNEVFRQYIDVVKMINNQYEDKIMSLSDYIKDNKEIYKLAVEIEKEFSLSLGCAQLYKPPVSQHKTQNICSYPPGGIRRKFYPSGRVKFFNRMHKTHIAFLNKVHNISICTSIFKRNFYHQPQIGGDQPGRRLNIACFHVLFCQLFFLFGSKQGILFYFA